MLVDFRLPHYIELNSTSAQPSLFGVAERYIRVTIKFLHP